MLQKKICLLGAFGVGKTSLVRRYVDTIFSDTYLTTVGVKIDKKVAVVSGEEVALIIWDIAGEDAVSAVRVSYLRGAAGYLLVVDGTRPETLETAASIQGRITAEIGAAAPFIALLNKADLVEDWTISPERLQQLEAEGWRFRRTSAKTGDAVNESFAELAALVATWR